MRYICILVCATTMTGCATTAKWQSSLMPNRLQSSQQPAVEAIATKDLSRLPHVDFDKAPSITQQYRLGKFSLGAWLNHTIGQHFVAVNIQHPDAAMVYLYRPDSQWNKQEILAPNFFLNGERIPSLLNNHYYWVELPAGQYRLSSSHPLAFQHFQKPKLLDFQVEAGRTYYIKYEEQGFRTGGTYQHPFYQMDSQVGLSEIRSTQLKSAGISFVKFEPNQSKVVLENIHGSQFKAVDKSQLSEKQQLNLKKTVKFWNPFSW